VELWNSSLGNCITPETERMKISQLALFLLLCRANAFSLNGKGGTVTRRTWFQKQTIAVIAGTCVAPFSASAAGSPSAAEIQKLQKGHARVQYLLENWDKGEIYIGP
jgi:hypothetical protein